MKFTSSVIIGKDVDMIRGHLYNVKVHAGFDKLSCDKEILVIVYRNPSIPVIVTDEIISVCEQNGAKVHIYDEVPGRRFVDYLYDCENLCYEQADPGFILWSGSDNAYNKDSFLTLYEVAVEARKGGQKVVLNPNGIEHSVRAMSNHNYSRHILGDFGDSFLNFNVEKFENFVKELNKNVTKDLFTIEESMAMWGKPTPFQSSLGYINRTEACSWLLLREDWEKYGPFVPEAKGFTGDVIFKDTLQSAGYIDRLVTGCVCYHFFRGESMYRFV
jgi:hypothetical protein